jgi:tetratricopeptide (TPR) repeat protein
MSAKQRRIETALARARQQLQAGQASQAAETCRRVLNGAPDQLEALKLGAIAAFQSGDRDQAIGLLQTATGRHPNDAQAHYNLGVVYQAGGNLDAALPCFRRAGDLEPGSADAHYNIATTLNELGHSEDAILAYNRAIEAEPGYAPAHAGLGFVLRATGRLDDAVAAYGNAIAYAPGDAPAHSGLGAALQALDRLPEAKSAYDRAVAADPDYPDACTNLADVLVQQGDPTAAVAACDHYLARHPYDAGVLASKIIALGEYGDTRAVESLVDFDRFLGPTKPETPAGYADIAALNDALAAHMLNHPTLIDAPTSHATRLGKHTGELLGDGAPPAIAFETMVRDAVNEYQRRLGADPAHPFVANAPARWRLTAWSIVLQDRGYQMPHIHPSAWLSGVYYVRVPDIVNDDDASQAGWIEFGLPSDEFHWSRRPALRAIRPEPGRMVLFPSYFFHRTVPFETAGTRISIAFDVLPDY